MMSACAVSWTTESKSILTQILKTSIAGRSCHICNALLQRMVKPMNEKSIAYSACHEAGHAFVRAKNGDRILLIDAIERFVSFRTPDWKCAAAVGTHPEQFSFVPHSCVAHQDDNIPEKFTSSRAPAAGQSSVISFLSASSSRRRCRPCSFIILIFGA